MLYKPGVGYGFGSGSTGTAERDSEVDELKQTIGALEQRVALLERQSDRGES